MGHSGDSHVTFVALVALVAGSVGEAMAFVTSPPRSLSHAAPRSWSSASRPQLRLALKQAGGGMGEASTQGDSQQSKLVRARALLQDSRRAFAESRDARSKSLPTGDEWGTTGVAKRTATRDLHAEFRIRAQWSRAGRALYGTWITVFGVKVSFDSDPLGLQGAPEEGGEENWIREVFDRLDLDHSGTLDRAEIEELLREFTGSAPDRETVRLLLSEASLTGGKDEQAVIFPSDFCGPYRALLDQKRALGLAAELAEADQKEQGAVVEAFKAAQEDGLLLNGARNASLRLDNLTKHGTLRLWNSGQVIKDTVTAKRMELEMNLTSGPDVALGLRPNWITSFRFTGIRWIGLIGVISLAISSCVPSAYFVLSRILSLAGLICSLVYLAFLIFSKQVDALLLHWQLEANPEGSLNTQLTCIPTRACLHAHMNANIFDTCNTHSYRLTVK